ncbi:MAG: ribokinase, partial [Chloroflexaceae bacterium]|nr:ribokinase [Chloroflexaceae bacterium]
AADAIAQAGCAAAATGNAASRNSGAAALAHTHGTRVLLNPAPAPDESERAELVRLLPLIDVLIPNESEAALLAGVALHDGATAAQAARALQQQGARSVVVTLGRQGALLLHEGQLYQQAAYPVQAVDTTAAGDAFVGAFAVALAEGLAPHEALRRGAAAGALAATQLGAQPSLPQRAAIERMVGE